MEEKPKLTTGQIAALVACILFGLFGLTRFGTGGPYPNKLVWVPITLGCFGAALGIVRRDLKGGLRLAFVIGAVLLLLWLCLIAAIVFSGRGWQS